jgi:transmembrane sensor
MTASPIDPILQTAADWFARLRDDADLDAWTDFQTWLEADPAHRLAYEDVEALWLDLEDPAAEALLATATATPSSPTDTKALEPRSTVTAFKSRSRRPAPWLIAGGAIAASIAALLLAPRWLPSAPTDYVTTKGEVRAVTLADGSRLTLGADTRVSVTMRAGRRDVILADGQAAFDVVHKPGSPFVVALGDQRVRVIGTEFNISRHAGRTAVTVRRGVVAVAQASGGEVRLTRGQQVLHTEGTNVQEVRGADPDAVFAWRSGRLIYNNAPLADVVADFNRYGGAPIRIDPSAANVKVSGVFLVDGQRAMVERLAQFSGVAVVTRPNEIVLKGQ